MMVVVVGGGESKGELCVCVRTYEGSSELEVVAVRDGNWQTGTTPTEWGKAKGGPGRAEPAWVCEVNKGAELAATATPMIGQASARAQN